MLNESQLNNLDDNGQCRLVDVQSVYLIASSNVLEVCLGLVDRKLVGKRIYSVCI